MVDDTLFTVGMQLCEQMNVTTPNINCTTIAVEICDIDKHFKIDSLKPYFGK